jgi:hypothetical protein
MNTNKWLITVILFFSMMFSACMDTQVTTILNADGSLDRILEVQSDSKLENYSGLPFPIDSTWQMVYKYDTLNSGKPHIYSFKKHYTSADEINLEYKKTQNALSKFNRAVKVEKKFRWFYTYFTYDEDYTKMARGNYKPFEMYLSDIEKEVRKIKEPDSISRILQLDSSKVNSFKKGIDEKYDNWTKDNLFGEVFIIMEQDMKTCRVTNIKIEDIKEQKDSINKFIDSIGIDKGAIKFYKALNKLFNTNEFDKIINSKKTGLNQLNDEVSYVIALTGTGFKYNLQMPGLLLDTNAETIKGNMLNWEFVPFEAYFVGSSKHAESRIINVWAFVVSGILLIGILVLLLIPGLRRKK